MIARRPRTRYERARSRIRRQLRADLASGAAPVHPEDAALTKALTEGDGIRADGLPNEHPESMALELAPADEVALAALSTDLWPADEYQQIITEDYRQRWDGAS